MEALHPPGWIQEDELDQLSISFAFLSRSIGGCKVQLMNRKRGLKVTVPSGSILGFCQGVSGWLDLYVLDLESAAPEGYVLGRLSAAVNATGAVCSREMLFPGCGEHPVLLTWCQAEKFEDKLSCCRNMCGTNGILGYEWTAGA